MDLSFSDLGDDLGFLARVENTFFNIGNKHITE